MARKLMDVAHEVFRIEHFGNRHPRELGAIEIQQFPTFLATDLHVSASSQNQALSAILFLYRKVVMERDIEEQRNGVSLPDGIGRKYKKASLSWSWQYLFPASRYAYITHNQCLRRHHAHSSGLARAVKSAVVEAGIDKRASCHTLRHSFATHLEKSSG